MQLSLLQLNCNGLQWSYNLNKYLQNNFFDILTFQEVAGKDTIIGNVQTRKDNLIALQEFLGNTHNCYFVKNDTLTSSPQAYFGNATFIKKTIPLIKQKVFWLHKRRNPFPSNSTAFGQLSHSVLAVQIATTYPLWILNTHLAWSNSQFDTPTKVKQGKQLISFIASLAEPFILTGDFNVDNKSIIVKGLEKYACNITKEYHTINTLNPRTHRAKHLFPPGLAVDFLFTSNIITVKTYKILEDSDLSDHLGVIAQFDI